ncbi:hypothetical protein CALVIDRAFT_392455 [Calocera viscosa TUFC12733]|uniref:F-box domain-containing protein n=1 Tax=Calocera viscosa (strain TUFC12733) TaxID=1330018 RepID=A0A167GDU5_CALVF|nr:hypothetical protein CALVIDRAFT_392455 [Calocera viscosa TUFC12733]
MSKTLFFVGMPLLSELTLDTRDMARQDVFTTTFLDHLALQPHLLLTKLVLYLSFQDVPWTQIVRLSTVEFLHIVKPIKDSFWDRSPSNLSVLYKKIKLPDGTQSWRLPRLHTVVLEATEPYGSISDEFVAGWRQCAVATKQLFMNRWETSMKSGGMLAPLAIDLIGPTWKFEIRHTNQSSNKTGDGRQVEPI